jgi:tetraacyldisaccharide 4'-kinase
MKGWRSTLFWLGRPFSPLYGGVMALRGFLYQRGIFKTERLPVPVICIGNLSMGGTGKTPLVMAITRMLQAMGRRPVLVSRGYRGRASAPVNVVSDGRQLLLDAVAAGDEPRLLAESLPGVPVLTGRKRVLAGRYGLEKFAADTVVLDDGFQHLALARDLDLVLFNAQALEENYRLFPGGDLREGFAALERAHGVVITGVDPRTRDRAETFKRFLRDRFTALPVFMCGYRPVALRREPETVACDFELIKEEPLCGFCGIATPESFRQTLVAIGCRLLGYKSFRDHYRYDSSDIAKLISWARQQGGRGLITTEKDFVKIKPFLGGDFPVYILTIELALEKDFIRFLKKEFGAW